ncbi:MAG: hypothetical protein WKF82_05220 [Nocardioidaceae bacterium]
MRVEHAVRAALAATTTSSSTMRRYRSHAAAFAVWANREAGANAIHGIFRLELIERYIEVGMPEAKESTRASRRSILRRIARHAHPTLSMLPEPTPLAYRRVRALRGARGRVVLPARRGAADRGRRDSLMAVLSLGLGCGLDCSDLGWVRGVDVQTTDNGVEVAVGGRRSRVVVCLSRYEDWLADLAPAAGQNLLIGGSVLGRHNVTSVTLGRLLKDTSVPPLVVSRLRSTWLTSHLKANTPLPLIMTAAGLKTVRPLEDLLEFAPGCSDAESARLLRRAC